MQRTPEPEDLEEEQSEETAPEAAGSSKKPSTPTRSATITKWVEKRAHRVVSKIYDSRADDLEHRARRAVSTAYTDKADDLEERAVRAMRAAITEESERIKEAIEHGVAVKKREVRLSLIVLVVAALIYLGLYYLQLSTPPS